MFKEKYIYGAKYHTVRDHHHYTGKNRSAAHNIFNLKYSLPKEIFVVFQKCIKL